MSNAEKIDIVAIEIWFLGSAKGMKGRKPRLFRLTKPVRREDARQCKERLQTMSHIFRVCCYTPGGSFI